MQHQGEWAALATAFFWTATAMSFEIASKRVGSLAVNMIRLVFAFTFLSVFLFVTRGVFLPLDATSHQWFWLSISGLIGFVFGDYFLFRAFAMITSRISMLIMTLVPPITAIIGFFLMGERMNILQISGMVLTISGIALAIFNRENKNAGVKVNFPIKGILFAVGGAFGQAIGLVLSKYGMQDYNAFAATQIRIIAGAFGFAIIVIVLKKQYLVKAAIKNTKGMLAITSGSFFGPFLGVSFSLLAVKYTTTGVASTIMSTVPILLIPVAIFILRQKVKPMEILGAIISVGGVSLLFI